MKKTENNPNYHMGKQTGYYLINGEYKIAPLYQEQLEHMASKELGIKRMLDAVTTHASEDFEALVKVQKKIWGELQDDIGLDANTQWVYKNGIVRKMEQSDANSK